LASKETTTAENPTSFGQASSAGCPHLPDRSASPGDGPVWVKLRRTSTSAAPPVYPSKPTIVQAKSIVSSVPKADPAPAKRLPRAAAIRTALCVWWITTHLDAVIEPRDQHRGEIDAEINLSAGDPLRRVAAAASARTGHRQSLRCAVVLRQPIEE